MKIKQKLSLLTITSAGRVTMLGLILVLALAFNTSFGDTPTASAAADYCAKTYATPKGSSIPAAERQTEIRSACQNGYGDSKCQGIKKGYYSTKAQQQAACDKGVAQKKKDDAAAKANPPSPIGTGDDCGGAETSIIKCSADNSGGLETNGVWALLLMAINILTAGVGIAAVGGIVYGSILYTSAGDNDSQVKQAKEVIRNVVIGVIAFIAMYALLQFIIPGGVFT